MPAAPPPPGAPAADSADLLQTLLAVSLTGVVMFRPVWSADGGSLIDFAYEFLNPAAQRMLGLPERPPQTLLTTYPYSVETGVFAFYRDTFLRGAASEFNVNYQGDGIDNYFRNAARRSGELLVVSFTDTADHDRTEVEQALRESQAREQAALAEAQRQREQLYRILTQAPAMICVFDGPQHEFQFVNPPYQALVGDRSLVGKPIAEAMPELERQPIFDLLDSVYRTGETFTATEMPVRLDHRNEGLTELEDHYYTFIYQARRDAAGAVDGIFVFAYEVTPQVLARHQMERVQEELEARVAARTAEAQAARAAAEHQRQELQRVFERAPVAIAILRGPELIIEQANEAIGELWGRRPADVLGLAHFEALPDTRGQGYEQILTGVAETGQPFAITESPVRLARAHTGRATQAYVNFTFQPLLDATHTPPRSVGVICVGIEVTDQVQARHQVQALNEELRRANADLSAANQRLTRTNIDLDNFVYTASHDLRAPIVNLEGLLHALREELPPGAPLPAAAEQVLGLMQTTIERFKQTIGHLSDIARLQQEDAEPAEPASVAEVLADVRLDLEPLLAAADARLTVDIDDCPTLPLSRRNLRSVLYNLLSNAVKYRHPARPPVVELRCYRHARAHVLTVRDNGLGLTPAQQAELFGLFRRLHTHVEGTGIGLYMVKRNVENAGGRVEVSSEPGVGSVFVVVFEG